MYWKVIRWGGSIAVIVMIGAALVVANETPNKPAETGGEQGLRIN